MHITNNHKHVELCIKQNIFLRTVLDSTSGCLFQDHTIRHFFGNEALSAGKTIEELWDGRLRGDNGVLRRRRKDGRLLRRHTKRRPCLGTSSRAGIPVG